MSHHCREGEVAAAWTLARDSLVPHGPLRVERGGMLSFARGVGGFGSGAAAQPNHETTPTSFTILPQVANLERTCRMHSMAVSFSWRRRSLISNYSDRAWGPSFCILERLWSLHKVAWGDVGVELELGSAVGGGNFTLATALRRRGLRPIPPKVLDDAVSTTLLQRHSVTRNLLSS